jgi:hypothetical protein
LARFAPNQTVIHRPASSHAMLRPTSTMDAIAFSLLLIAVGVWLTAMALRDARVHWTFIRELPEQPAHDDSHSPFRASEPGRGPMYFDDRGERRALKIARVAGSAALVLAIVVTRWMVDDLPADARWIIVGWSVAIGSLMIHDQLCREWWAVMAGVPALFFAALIDTALAGWALAIWLTHVGLRVWIEQRSPLPPHR